VLGLCFAIAMLPGPGTSIYTTWGGRDNPGGPTRYIQANFFLDTLHVVYARMTYVVSAYPLGYSGL